MSVWLGGCFLETLCSRRGPHKVEERTSKGSYTPIACPLRLTPPTSHPPVPSAMIMFSSFLDRVGKYEFHPAQPMWGYLPQVNQWGSTALEWEVERIGGKDHIPIFKAIPVCE